MQSQRNGILLGSAATRLIKLFPGTPLAARAMRIMSEINPPVIAAKPTANVGARCKERGCCYPALAGHDLWRGHLVDRSAQASLLPSCAAAAIGGSVLTQCA
jgi:hypothetical protein